MGKSYKLRVKSYKLELVTGSRVPVAGNCFSIVKEVL
jgi:hypothetical protein